MPRTTTLAQYQSGFAVSWAKPDCDHVPGMWRRDLSSRDIRNNNCVTECQHCNKPLRGTWTAWGKVLEWSEKK